MSFIKKFILPFFTCILGLFIGAILKDIPYIKFNPELKIYEVLNLCITFSIGIFIPFLIKKWIDDNRAIKALIGEEVKSTIFGLNLIKQRVTACYTSGLVKVEDKDQINLLFNDADLLFSSLGIHLSKSLKLNVDEILKQSKENYLNYWKYVTGGSLMNSNFNKIDLPFFIEHNRLYKLAEDSVKMISHDVHKA